MNVPLFSETYFVRELTHPLPRCPLVRTSLLRASNWLVIVPLLLTCHGENARTFHPPLHTYNLLKSKGYTFEGGELLHQEPRACATNGRLEQYHQSFPGQAHGHAGRGQDALAWFVWLQDAALISCRQI